VAAQVKGGGGAAQVRGKGGQGGTISLSDLSSITKKFNSSLKTEIVFNVNNFHKYTQLASSQKSKTKKARFTETADTYKKNLIALNKRKENALKDLDQEIYSRVKPLINTTPRQQKEHGMTTAESLQSVTIGGMTIHAKSFEPGTPGFRSIYNLAEAGDKFPPKLLQATKNIYLSEQSNSHDDYWRSRYKNFTESAATGGDGNIVVYKGASIETGLFAHEAGHNLAKSVYGSTSPPADSAYGRAYRASGAVSDYAKNSISEDFAESVRLHVESPDSFSEAAPIRSKIVRDILEE
jgi:hypothetical protein